MYFEEKLKLLIKSRQVLLYIVTNEEERIEHILNKVLKEELNNSIYYWDFIDGYYNNPNYDEKAKKNPLAALEIIENSEPTSLKTFVLRDFHLFINDLSIIRKMKNLSKKLKYSNLHIIICASEIHIPALLQELITTIELPLPNIKEIKIELNRLSQILPNKFIQQNIETLALSYKGFPIERIRRSIYKLTTSYMFEKYNNKNIIKNILEEKKQFIKQTAILDFYPSNTDLEDIGGLTNLKQWLHKRSSAFSIQAKNYGIPSPKGLLLVGVQGTGKSLSAKAISQEWKIPLLRLDVGKLFSSLVGESEARMRQMINLAEASAPCVLWIDEIDKVFTKINNNNDSGTTNRVLGSFLTWLSEKESQVFVVATANNIMNLPTEILRKGRFDEIFFLDLPHLEERLNIFQIHLMKIRPLTWHNYDIKQLSKLTNKFSGAEIKQVIIEAMYNGFYENREFTTNDIINAIQDCIPLSFTDKSTINTMQEWARLGKVRLASNSSQ